MRFPETLAMMIVVAVTASAATWLMVMGSIDARFRVFAEHRPPLAVIDYASVYDALKAGVPPSKMQAEFERIGAAGDRLAQAGYLVFTSAQVVKVPEGSMISAPPIAAPDMATPALDVPLDLGFVVDGLVEGGGIAQ